ncbi:MAG: hypothetical protein FD189_478 [Elusimicrobia bacterium]|nr:MAG: hypothetical protein FD154_1765 [Elusimicrobiota bacterium]KAF0157464.1 MAG: hypothetical protein FD189_478 [Elusimicrobiota bacterium]
MKKHSLLRKIIYANTIVFASMFLLFTALTILKAYSDNYRIAEEETEINLRKSVASASYHFKKSDFIELQRFVSSFTEPGKGTSVLISLPSAAKPAAGLRAVLLDDDPLVHMNWRMAAKAAGAELNTYKTPRELAAAAATLPRDIPLYIDSELADGAKGEDIAAELHDKGFSDITMATGHGPDKFAHLPWLKVSGKEPPWSN